MKRPCEKHKSMCAPDWRTPEVMGMQKHGVRFEQCEKCKWIIMVKEDGKETDNIQPKEKGLD